MCRGRTLSTGRPVSMIAGLSELAIRRQIADTPSLTYIQLNDPHRTDMSLQRELDTEASHDTSAVEHQAVPVAEVTSTGTNTVADVVVTEDQATETGRLQCTLSCCLDLKPKYIVSSVWGEYHALYRGNLYLIFTCTSISGYSFGSVCTRVCVHVCYCKN